MLYHTIRVKGDIMNYRNLAEEYFTEAEVLKGHINNLKSQYKGEICPENSDVYYRVSTLYAMYLELRHTGEYLMRKSEVIENV